MAPIKELTFDEKTHSYHLGGVKLPSVTTVIKNLYDYAGIDPEVLRKAGLFGTAVHKMVELYLLDDLDEECLDPGLIGCLQGFKKWQDDYPALQDTTRMALEQRMADAKLMFAGTSDIIIDGLAIIDIKTRKVNSVADPVQLEAYERLWITNGGTKAKYDRRVLEIHRDGTYRYMKATHREAWSRFRFCLDHYNNGQKIQSWRKDK